MLIRQRDPVARAHPLAFLSEWITRLLVWAAGPIVLGFAWWRSMGLRARIAAARVLLQALDPAMFADAGTRVVRAQAGLAHLEMAGEPFLHEFGLPNLYFHQAMAHVALKLAGVPLGKADFDGLHVYPEGFSFG